MGKNPRLKIEDAGFSTATCDLLKQAKLFTLGHLTFCTREDLAETHGFTEETIQEVESKLKEYGFRLVTQEELEEMYEDEMQTLSEMEAEDLLDAKVEERVTRDDLVRAYLERYVNEKNIKKYAKVDEQKVKAVFDNAKDEYLDFLYNIIMANDVLFSMDRTQHCNQGETDANGVNRTKVFATLDEKDGNTFFHEMGHAASLCLSEDRSCRYKLLYIQKEGNETLEQVLKQELAHNKEEIKAAILEDHRASVAPSIGEDKYQSIAQEGEFLKEYYKVSRSIGANYGIFIPSFRSNRQNSTKFQENYAKYQEMNKRIVEKKIVATRNELIAHPDHKKFREENETVLDLLSSVCDMDCPFGLEMHTQKYYEKCPEYQLEEIWANMFALKITGRDELLEKVRKYLPATCDAFESVFDYMKQFYELQKAMRNW